MNKKAVVMLSGGLDSTLAACLMLEQGVEMVGLYLSAPWGCCDKTKAMKVARKLGISFTVIKMSQEYIGVLRNPRYGYGSSMNPCIDCRIFMFEKAKTVMEQVGASFLVTGEVLGQRPMSQMRPALLKISDNADMDRLVVRPLSAKLLPITLPEETGIIDREKMLDIQGRSRKIQMALAIQYGITDYPTPAGGCQLTDKQFGRRVKDLFDHQDKIDLEDMELLRLGRHFRISDQTKMIVGRNNEENMALAEYLAPGRLLYAPVGFGGPSVLVVGPPAGELDPLAGTMIARYTGKKKLPKPARAICRLGRPREGEEGAGTALEQTVPVEERFDWAEIEKMRVG